MNSTPARSRIRASASEAAGPKISSGRGSGVTTAKSGPAGNSRAASSASSYSGSAQPEPGGSTNSTRERAPRTAFSTAPALIGPRNSVAPGTASTGRAPGATTSRS